MSVISIVTLNTSQLIHYSISASRRQISLQLPQPKCVCGTNVSASENYKPLASGCLNCLVVWAGRCKSQQTNQASSIKAIRASSWRNSFFLVARRLWKGAWRPQPTTTTTPTKMNMATGETRAPSIAVVFHELDSNVCQLHPANLIQTQAHNQRK